MDKNLILGETKYVPLPRGGTLEIQMTQSFVDRVKYQFGLQESDALTDDHIRMFIWGALNFAIDKATR